MALLVVLMLAALLVPVWIRLPGPRWLWGWGVAWLVLFGAHLAGSPTDPHLSSALLMTGFCAVVVRALEKCDE